MAMPGKTSEQHDNMVAQEVVTNDDTLRTCGDLDDLDEYVVATVVAKRGERVFNCASSESFKCSELYDELECLCGDMCGQGMARASTT